MEELIKITQILDAYRLRQIDIVGNEESESRHSVFLKLLKDGTIKTDKDAVRYFYGEDATPQNFNYRQLKSAFRERLLNTLFFIDMSHPSFGDLESASMKIQKEWAAINILFTKDEVSLPVQLSERLLPTAIKYELTEIVVYITDRLKNSYGGQIGNTKKYAHYKKLQKEHMAIWQAEIAAKDLYQELRMHYIKSNAHKPYVAKIAERGLKELQPMLEKYKTIRLIYYAFIAKIGQFTAVNDFKAAIKVCDEGIAEFRQKPFEAQRLINAFLNQKLICHIQMREYEAGQVLVSEILSLQVEGSLSWFKTLEYSMVLAFHTKNYEQAYVLYSTAWKNDKIKTLTLRHLEIWHLYKAYLFFLISIGSIRGATLKSEEFVDFKLNKFLNDMSLFGRDSEGMKISVLIIEIALNLVEEKFGKMIDTSEALAKYRQRHLSKSHALYRHNTMIKMIGMIPRSGFIKSKLKKITEVPLRNMKKIPMQTDGQSFQAEIIPLEDMWDFILNTLRG